MAGRVFRFALRLAKDGIDYRTLIDAWGCYKWEVERREREREREPRPRPLPYVEPDHGEATSAAIPRAPRFPAHALGTGAAHLRWMLLDPLATVGDATEFRGRADFDILYEAPPGLSILHLHASAADATAAYDVVSVDGDGGVLLIGVRYSDPAHLPALAYLLCHLATRRATPVPTSLARRPRRPGRVGIIRGSNRVVLAELEEGHGESRLRVIVFPDVAEPFVLEIAEPFPAGVPQPWGGHGVLTHGGYIYFIDQTTGMLRFDPEDPATLHLITFPAAAAGQHHARYVGVTDGAMMLAVVDQGGHLRTWAFSSEEWEQRHLVMTLPVSHCFGFLHLIDAQIVYLLTSSGAGQSLVVRANLKTGACTVEGSIPSASSSRLITIEMR